MKNPDPTADGLPAEAEAEDLQTQQVDLRDVDLSDLPDEPVASNLPPGLPPLPPVPPLAPPGSLAPPPLPSLAPPAPSRGPMFYVGALVGVLVLSAAVGTVVALSRRRPAPPTAAMPAASGATAAPKVITIGTIEMDDNPDSGP